MRLFRFCAPSLLVLAFACGSDDSPEGYGVNRGDLSARKQNAVFESIPIEPANLAAVDRSDAVREASGPADLVPEDAIGYLQVSSIDALDELVRDVAAGIDPSMAAMYDVESLKQGLLMRGGNIDELRTDAPFGIAFSLSSETGQPEPTFILPVREARRFMRSITSAPGMARPVPAGNWIGVPMRSSYPLGTGTAPMATGLPTGGIVARVDLARLIASYRPMVGMAMNGMRDNMNQRSGGMSPVEAELSQLSFEWIDRFIESAEHLDVTFDMRGGEMDLGYALSMRAGSPLADFGSEGGHALAELARYVNATDTFSVLGGWDQAFYTEHVRPMVTMLAELGAADAGQLVETGVAYADEFFALMGTSFVTTGDWTLGSLDCATYFKPAEAAAAFTRFEELMDELPVPDGCEVVGPTRSEVDGAQVMELSLVLDGEEGERLAMIFGEPRFDLRLGSKNGHMVACAGGSAESFRARVAELGGTGGTGGMPSDLARAFGRIEGGSPSFAYRVDMLGLARSVPQAFADEMGGGGARLDAAMLEGLGDEPIPMTFYGAVDGVRWRGGMVCELERLMEFVNATR